MTDREERTVLIEKEGDNFVIYTVTTDAYGPEKIRKGHEPELDDAGRVALELAQSLGIGIDRVKLGSEVPLNILDEGASLTKTLASIKGE